jgi:hypothetical protein
VRGTIQNPKIENGEVDCPNCGKKIKINPGKCPCGVKIHLYRKRGKIVRMTWCGPGNH